MDRKGRAAKGFVSVDARIELRELTLGTYKTHSSTSKYVCLFVFFFSKKEKKKEKSTAETHEKKTHITYVRKRPRKHVHHNHNHHSPEIQDRISQEHDEDVGRIDAFFFPTPVYLHRFVHREREHDRFERQL